MQNASSSSKKSLKDELHILWDAGTNQSHLKRKHALTSVQKLGNRQADKLDVKNKKAKTKIKHRRQSQLHPTALARKKPNQKIGYEMAAKDAIN